MLETQLSVRETEQFASVSEFLCLALRIDERKVTMFHCCWFFFVVVVSLLFLESVWTAVFAWWYDLCTHELNSQEKRQLFQGHPFPAKSSHHNVYPVDVGCRVHS